MALTKHNERYGPYMTANNAPAPYAAAASQNSWGAFRAFSESLDDDISFTGLAAGTEQWVQITLDKAIRIWAFRIACRTTVSAKDAGQVPKNFKALGSTDGITFEDIQTYTDMEWSQFTSWDATNNKYDWGDSRKIEIDCSKEYQYYRFSFGECQSVSTQKLGSMIPTSSNTVKVTLIDMYQVEGEAGPEITGIRITYPPDKKRYEIGESFDATGMEVMADMSDGKAQTVTDYTLSGYDSATTGQKTVTVTYQGHTATFSVTVYELSSIAITTPPDKVQYNVGDALDLTGMVVTATYSDSVIGVITDYTVSGYDGTTAGTCTVTVTYQGESASFEVTVAAQVDSGDMTYTVTVNNGSGSGSYHPGDTVICSTDEKKGYKFLNWNVDGVSIKEPARLKDYKWQSSSNSTSHKCSYTGTVGNLLVLAIITRGEMTLTPDGWTLAGTLDETGDEISGKYAYSQRLYLFYKVCEGIETVTYEQSLTNMSFSCFVEIIGSTEVILKEYTRQQNVALTDVDTFICSKKELELFIWFTNIIAWRAKDYAWSQNPANVVFQIPPVSEKQNPRLGIFIDDNIPSIPFTLTYNLEGSYCASLFACGIPGNKESEKKEKIVTFTMPENNVTLTAEYKELELKDLLCTTENMEVVRNNVKNDDGTDTVTGVDWFTYAGKACSNIYVSGNNWIGFGASTEQLKICNRDGAVYYVYRQEGVLYVGTKFLKLRVEGYTHYSNSNMTDAYKVVYELFLFDDGYFFINVIQSPNISENIGTSQITDGKNTATLDIPAGVTAEAPVEITVENAGVDQVITYGRYAPFIAVNMEITTLPDKTIYYVNELFDITGLTVSLVDPDGNKKTVSGYILSGFDSSTPGKKTIEVTKDDFVAAFNITVSEIAITGIEISSTPTKTEYSIGEKFNPDGLVVSLLLSDGTKSKTELYQMTGFDNSTSGTKTMTVVYGDYSVNFSIVVTTNIVEYIGSPNLEDVVASLNVTSGILTVSGTGETKSFSHSRGDDLFGGGYSEYTREIVIGEGITKLGSLFPYYNEVTKATLPSTLTHILYQYEGCFGYCEKLKEISIPESLSVINGFRDCTGLTELTLGENVTEIGDSCFYNCPNLVVTIKNKDCVIYDGYSIQGKLIKGYSGSTAEEYAAANTIPFESIDIITSISVYSVPYKVTYFVLEKELDTTGLEIQGITDTGTSVTVTTYSVSAVDFSTAGTKTVTVTYKDLTTTFDITVINPSFESICNCTTGMTDGTTASASWFMYNGVAAESISCRNGRLKFNDAEDGVSVCASAYPYKSYYSYMLETVLDNGVRVLKFRTHYLTKNSTSAHVEHEIFLFSTNDIYVNVIRMPDDGSTVGDIGSAVGKLVSNGKEYNFNFKKGEPAKRSCYHLDDAGLSWNIKAEAYAFPTAPSRIEITKLPDKVIYLTGENLELSGMVVSLFYDNGTVEETTKYTVSGFDSSEPGNKTITVTYQGFTATFSVIVYGSVTGIRIAHYPDKVYYKIGDALDTTGLQVAAITEGGLECPITDYTLSALDSSTVGNKEIKITYEVTISSDTKAVYFAEFSVKVTATGDNPFEDNLTPYKITVHWPNGEFADIGNDDLTGTMTLQESICSNNYFIFGGCICNQISFTTHSKQFMAADEDATPHGDIEVYVESKGTKVKIFTGTIDSGKRTAGLTQRNIIAYDYLYKFRNTDIAWWYKNKAADKNMLLTQKQFRDMLFDYLGIEQVQTKLYYDSALVPDTNQANEINVANILKDLCLQNSVFGWVNRDGKFEYLKLPHNSRAKSMDNAGNIKYAYYDAQIYVDTYESCDFSEGRIWYPKEFLTDPPVGMFTPGGLTAQEAYESNVYYNRNSFFVGDADWLDSAFQGDEYGTYTVMEPIFPICYGTTSKTDNQHLYRAQGYTLTLRGNPLNKVGDSIEITVRKTAADGTQLEWVIHSYIMSRTLKLTGDTSMTDTYTAKNGPYNGNDSQAGNNTAEHSAELFRLRSDGPTISYAPFTDGAATLAVGDAKKDRLRCVKSLTEAEYTALQTAGGLRTDTLYFIKE